MVRSRNVTAVAFTRAFRDHARTIINSFLTIYCSCQHCHWCDTCVFLSFALYICSLFFCHSCDHCWCVQSFFGFRIYMYILYYIFTVLLSPPQLPVLLLAQRKCVRLLFIICIKMLSFYLYTIHLSPLQLLVFSLALWTCVRFFFYNYIYRFTVSLQLLAL